MPSSPLTVLAAGRIRCTGESRPLALSELSMTPPGMPPIPDPGNAGQAALESDFLEAIGHCSKDRWRHHMLPFGVKSVTPRRDELIVRIAKEFLPDIIRDVLPSWAVDENGGEEPVSDIEGIPGLRARHVSGRIVLSRPGLAGRISIPASYSRWHKAAQIAADLLEYESGASVRIPWLTDAHDWHPAETRYVDSWPRRYSPDGARARHCVFASRIMRRLPGLCPAPYPYYHDLWFNHHGDTYSIQFEWAFGSTHDVILPVLLDPLFGAGTSISLCKGQTLADCYSGTEYVVKVHDDRQPDTTIALRRAVWDQDETASQPPPVMFKARREYRYLLEGKYRY